MRTVYPKPETGRSLNAGIVLSVWGKTAASISIMVTEIWGSVNNYIHCFMWDVISLIHALTLTKFNEIKAWMSNYIPMFYVDVITYLRPKIKKARWK